MSGRAPGRALVGVVIFFASFSVMSLELAASRLMMPHFGSSIFVWGTLISVILLATSVGYAVGGRVADRRPPRAVLATLLLSAGLWVGVADLVAPRLLAGAASMGLVGGTLAASAALFLAPMAALGAMTPAVLKLRIDRTETVGTVTGDVFFLSSLGSVIGTLSTTFVFIPFLGTVRTIAVVALVLGLLGVSMVARRRGGASIIASIALAPLLWPPPLVASVEGLLYQAESPYQFVRVVEQRGRRYLLLNADEPGRSFNSVDTMGVLTGFYFDDMALAPAMVPGAADVLVLGLGGGTVVKTMLALYPELVVDGVELDPAVLEAAARFLGLVPGPRLRVHQAGGRAFLQSSDRRWDVIVVDVFQNGPFIPFHFATREFYEQVAHHLSPGGVLVANVEIVEKPLLNAIGAALPYVWTARRGGNVVTFASNEPLAVPISGAVSVPDALGPVMDRVVAVGEAYTAQREPLFTDDRAPVELEVALFQSRRERRRPPD